MPVVHWPPLVVGALDYPHDHAYNFLAHVQYSTGDPIGGMWPNTPSPFRASANLAFATNSFIK